MVGAYVASTVIAALPSTPIGFFSGLLVAALAVRAGRAVIEVAVLRRILRRAGNLPAARDLRARRSSSGPRAPSPGDREERFARGVAPAAGSVGALRRVHFPSTRCSDRGRPLVFALLAWLLKRTRWGVWIARGRRIGERRRCARVNEPILFSHRASRSARSSPGLAARCRSPGRRSTCRMAWDPWSRPRGRGGGGRLGSVTGAHVGPRRRDRAADARTCGLPQSTLVLIFVVMAVVLVVRPRTAVLGRPQAERARQAADAPPSCRCRPREVAVARRSSPSRRLLPLWSALPSSDRHGDGDHGRLLAATSSTSRWAARWHRWSFATRPSSGSAPYGRRARDPARRRAFRDSALVGGADRRAAAALLVGVVVLRSPASTPPC